MRIHFATLAAALVVLLSPRADARLPDGVSPRRQSILLRPDLAAGTFRGETTIEVSVARPTDRVVLHSLGLALENATVTAGGRAQPARVTLDEKAETATLAVPSPLPAGEAHILLRFAGKLDDQLRGLYRARAGGRLYALTQFESTDARRAFPCFDEPALKARFQLTAIVREGDAAISNTPIVKRTREAPGWERVEFGETLPMSSYLVALAVGPFESRTTTIDSATGKLPITVWAAPGRAALGAYALAEAARVVPRLEAWFGVPYPYDKLDLIAAPEFMYGGMENVAAIVFKDSALLVLEHASTVEARRHVTEVVAHEIAHQWFGDLVTMAWWDDVWLNESFATWMESKVIADLHPEWHVWRDFAVERAAPLAEDALPHAHPIHFAGAPDDGDEPETSATIIYGKGAAVLRMLERWLGEEAFRRGVGKYIADHRFGNTRAADLWSALAAASGKPVGSVADAWITRPGYPLVTLATSCEGGHTHVAVSQERFTADGSHDGTTWPVPLWLRWGKPGEPQRERCELVTEPRASFVLDGPCADAVVGNAGAAGFFRTRYDDGALQHAVTSPSLAPEERASLLDDERALVETGRERLGMLLDVARLFGRSGANDRAVLDAVLDTLQRIERVLLDEADRPRFAAIVRQVVEPVLDRLGTDVRRDDDDDRRVARAHALQALGLLARDEPTIAEARRRFASWMRRPASLDPSLVDAVASVALRDGTAAEWEAIEHRALGPSATPEEHERLLDLLGRFERPELVARTLALGLDARVAMQDADRPLRNALARRASSGAALRFLDEKLAALEPRMTPYGPIRVLEAAATLCTEEEARTVERAFTAHPAERTRLTLSLALDAISACARTREANRAALARQLGQASH